MGGKMESIESVIPKDFEISDKELLEKYNNRFSYNQVKRKVVELMYEKAVGRELREQYERVSRKRHID